MNFHILVSNKKTHYNHFKNSKSNKQKNLLSYSLYFPVTLIMEPPLLGLFLKTKLIDTKIKIIGGQELFFSSKFSIIFSLFS
jgi:hypothetical protein